MELLAPVGYKDALKAAIIGGADAVYLGGKDFGARRLAENFDDGEMRSAIKLCRSRQIRRRSSSSGEGATTIAQTRGSPRL